MAVRADHERRPRTPVRKDERGMHVEGGRDKGATPPEGRAPMRTNRRFITFVLLLLALNYLLVSMFAPGTERAVRIPYSPAFLEQVRSGNVERINAQGDTVDGEFRREVRYPPNNREVEPTRFFETEVPAFANDDQLDDLLRDNNVTIEAQPINDGRGVLLSLLLGFGPVIL